MREDNTLIRAVLIGDINRVLPLITPETINAKGKWGKTALQNAVFFSDTPDIIVNTLLNRGADVNALDDEGHNPLSDAGKGARTINDIYARRACQLIEKGALWPNTDLGNSAWQKLPSPVQQLFTEKLQAYQQQQEQIQAEEKTKAFGVLSNYARSLNTQSSNSSGLHHRNVVHSTELKTFN
ncbi:MAG: hypothetical protein WC748_05050 [Legionellales bacterium]|jgi:hypothetical protein